MTSTIGAPVGAIPAGSDYGGIVLTFVPILDVARATTTGYQTRAEFDTASDDHPRLGSPLDFDLDGSRTAHVARMALAVRHTLPSNTFLTIPVSAQVAATPEVRMAFAAHANLSGIVLDLTGFAGGTAPGALDLALADYRSAGALIAIGGHDAAQPELSSIIRFKPAILRLGRDWVRGVDVSEAKRSAVEVIGQLAGQLDTWILAEGIASAAELRSLAGLNVPLAQGPFIGDAMPVWPSVNRSAATALPRTPKPGVGVLQPYVQPAYTTRDAAAAEAVLPDTTGFDLVVVVDDNDRPHAILERLATGAWEANEAMTVNVDTPVADVIARSMARPRAARFAPLACTDDEGVLLGVLRLERLLTDLSVSAS